MIIGFLLPVAWFFGLSAAWLAAVGLAGALLINVCFGFAAFSPPAWLSLYEGFMLGGTVPFSFVLTGIAMVTLAVAGEGLLAWRLPSIIDRFPPLPRPRISWPKLRLPRRRVKAPAPQAPPPPIVQPIAPPAAPAPPLPPSAVLPAVEAEKPADAVIWARILALFEVWAEPPPSWMTDAVRDEIAQLSPVAWPMLETLGNQGLRLLMTLEAHDLLPTDPSSGSAIDAVADLLRRAVAEKVEDLPAAPPVLTMAAAWLCEALDNFLAAQKSDPSRSDRLTMAEAMLTRAMRGMADEDWASLDRFPEKARHVRVLTDRLREDLRPRAAAKTATPPTPVETLLGLLKQFGFAINSGAAPDIGGAPHLAQRDDLLLLLQMIDLKDHSWRLPQGPLGPWVIAGETSLSSASYGRQLWQQLSRQRLRHADPRPLAGLLVIHRGRIEEQAALAELVAADRRRSGIGLAWLNEAGGGLPPLQQELTELPKRLLKERHLEQAAPHEAFQP